ncbi:MAG: hypothetical protein ACREJ2_16135 [Planctomycetota bacterium]
MPVLPYKKCAILLAAAVLAASASLAAADAPRVGFDESFTTKDGWSVVHGAPIGAIELNALPKPPAPALPAGTPPPHMLFTTVCGALDPRMQRADWPEWPKHPFDSSTRVRKTYDQTVDLDEYHYLVIDLPIRGANVVLAMDGESLPIAYTTGLRAYDLRLRDEASLKGKQQITISLEFLNTSGSVGFNAIRLVRELTAAEKKALMPAPIDLHLQKLTMAPYNHLEALNARAGRANLPEYEGQLCVYKDSATGAEIWKLTDQPGDQSFRAGDSTLGWSADGRYFQINGGRDGRNVFDFQTGKWLATESVGDHPLPDFAARCASKKHPGVVYGYTIDYNHPPDKIFRFAQFDPKTGKTEPLGDWKTPAKWDVRELAVSDTTDLAAVGLRGSPAVCLIDPDAADPAQRIRPITLSTRLKGLHFGKKDTTLIWWNCYTYEQWERVIATGATHLGYYTGGSHAGGGGGFTLNHYEGLTLIRPDDLTDWQAGDAVKIFAYYKHPFESDYGELTDGGRFWVVNGTSGDVANQILMVDAHDPASVMQIATMNTSRNDWATNTYTLPSPDGTKIAWVSDQLGDGDVYFAVAGRPENYIGSAFKLGEGHGKLWCHPPRAKEFAGYRLYFAGSDFRFAPLSNQLLAPMPLAQGQRVSLEWSGTLPPGTQYGLVTACDRFGFESIPDDIWEIQDAPWTSLLRPQGVEPSPSAHAIFDAGGAGLRSFRAGATGSGPDERATLTGLAWDPQARYFVHERINKPGSAWNWVELTGTAIHRDAAGAMVVFDIPADQVMDQALATRDPKFPPDAATDCFTPPLPPTDPNVAALPHGVLKLTWKPSPALNLHHTEIFACAKPDDPCDNTTVIGAVLAQQPQQFYDWGGGAPGAKEIYKLVAVDGRGNRSQPVSVEAAWPAVAKPVTLKIDAADLKLDPNLKIVQRGGEKMVATEVGVALDLSMVDFEAPFHLPVAGDYAIWVRYSPGKGVDGPLVRMEKAIDGIWKMRQSYRPMSGTLAPAQHVPVKLFSDRLAVGSANQWTLLAGDHVLRLGLSNRGPALDDSMAIGTIWITNDPSFHPPGYDPRADFKK